MSANDELVDYDEYAEENVAETAGKDVKKWVIERLCAH